MNDKTLLKIIERFDERLTKLEEAQSYIIKTISQNEGYNR